MSELLESAVVYDGLPISSGGSHGLGNIKPREALRSWLRFIDTCTETSDLGSSFDFPQTPELKVDRSTRRLIERAFPGRDVPWERIDEALTMFQSLEPLPRNEWGMAPVWLWFTAAFRLRSPRNGGVWPGQDPALFGSFETSGGVTLGTCSSSLILEGKRGMTLILTIPMATDEDLDELVPWLQAALPMRLSSKHWTRWTLTKDGRSYRGRKIVPRSLT